MINNKSLEGKMEEAVGKVAVMMMTRDYVDKNKSMEEIWNNWIKEEVFSKVVRESDYKMIIGTLCGGIELATELLHIKKLKNDHKGRLFLIRKIEENINLLRKYTEEVM